MCLTLSFLDDLDDQDAGSKASIREIFGMIKGRLSASTPAAATAVLRRPMIRMRIELLLTIFESVAAWWIDLATGVGHGSKVSEMQQRVKCGSP
jgi:hypothetical protein